MTLLHSVPQIVWWLRVLLGQHLRPPEAMRKLWGRDFIVETFDYDLDSPSTFVVEVSSLKTVWCELVGMYRFPIQLRSLSLIEPEIQHCLPSQSADELWAGLVRLYAHVVPKRLVLVCQQVHEPAIPARVTIRDAILRFAQQHKECVAIDPTKIVQEHGAEKCLIDSIHWTEFGLEQLNLRVKEACCE